eukprot:COSAG01_NODE_2920_length_6825_cov_27.601452_5_plen_230_part_00
MTRSSYYLSPTPFGDTVDTLLSDALPSVLAAYHTLVVAHRMTAEPMETARKLHEYVARGGHLVLTASAVLDLGGTFAGIQVGACAPVSAGTKFQVVGGDTVVEPMPLQLCAVTAPENATILASTMEGAPLPGATAAEAQSSVAAGQTAALGLLMSSGGGSVTLLAHGNYAMSTTARTADIFKCGVDDDPHADRQPCVTPCQCCRAVCVTCCLSTDTLSQHIMGYRALST